ncbi:hypothetical protein [uncultured Alsobacter sp.]|uniref:hypothetical protein n=1 Tax=uncultured Alsobacter sp. TaxID=1748258 RepID=UPI0025FE33F0|nr:hypothetical protein [uncultured Alsobacter sp.]
MFSKLAATAFAVIALAVAPGRALASCASAGASITSPTSAPCAAVAPSRERKVTTARTAPATARVKAPKPASSQQDDDDQDPSVAIPLAGGVNLDGRIGSLRAGDGQATSVDDVSNRRRGTVLPRTRAFSGDGFRTAGPQALRKRAGDGAAVGLTFDLPQ